MSILPAILASFYLGAGGGLQLAQGGGDLSRAGGGQLRIGAYVRDFLAVEGEAAQMEKRTALAVRGLWHWWGYERLDPFFTFGVRGWIRDGDVGPCGGTGFFYHIDDHWSLRTDFDATLGIERKTEMVYGISAGIQYEF